MAWPASLTVSATLLALAGAALACAAIPGRDPFGMSENGRMSYVYAAEVILAVLFAHVRMTMPWLFRGLFRDYWPLVLMALAFGGLGLAELLHRQGRRVLSVPLVKSGAMLPLLPVVAFWVGGPFESRVDYGGLMLLVSVLYLVLASRFKSFGFALLAIAAGSGGLWRLFHHNLGITLLERPQLWMIPPAGCVLLASYLHRDRLSAAQHAAIRYACLIVIYVSSTGDLFLHTQSFLPPVILTVLSVAGAMVGIGLRIRSFLYLGCSFLFLALLAMIRCAVLQTQWTWLWYVFGLMLGIAIFVVFMFFESRREKMLATLNSMRTWKA